MVNPESKRSLIAALAKQIADHQARLQVIAANWGDDTVGNLDATEKEVLRVVSKELRDFEFSPNAKETLQRLQRIIRKVSAIRHGAYTASFEELEKSAMALVENEAKWAKRLTQEMSAKEAAKTLKLPTATALSKVVRFGLASGATIKEYFDKLAEDDAVRIESTIRQGVQSGWTIDQMARNITGTAENDYKDGIFETSRRSAVNMARTVCNAVANNAKEEFYRANSDVLLGVEILATLDGRTCPVCASIDRMRYKFDEPHPALPIHHQCRCVLLPVTTLTDKVQEQRPMANADFMAEAKRNYAKKYPKKDFDKLADSTKKRYYYQAMREYEERTGKPAYSQVTGSVSFREYFTDHMSEQQKKDWLGPERYAIYKRGNLPLDKFIPPYPNKRLTVDALKGMDKESFSKKSPQSF